jgi:hypothetical protein
MENRLFKLVTCGVLVVTQAGCSKTPEAAKISDDQSTKTASQAATTVAQQPK